MIIKFYDIYFKLQTNDIKSDLKFDNLLKYIFCIKYTCIYELIATEKHSNVSQKKIENFQLIFVYYKDYTRAKKC